MPFTTGMHVMKKPIKHALLLCLIALTLCVAAVSLVFILENRLSRVSLDGKGRAFQERMARQAGVPVTREITLADGVAMTLAYIPPESFLMGTGLSDDEAVKRYPDLMDIPAAWYYGGLHRERPRSRVTLTQGFYLSETEMTRAHWNAVMGLPPPPSKEADLPAAQITWDQAQQFVSRLNEKGIGRFALPTEAQWERACRAGTTSEYFFGEDPSVLGQYAHHGVAFPAPPSP